MSAAGHSCMSGNHSAERVDALLRAACNRQ
jgi:hypothetical protein